MKPRKLIGGQSDDQSARDRRASDRERLAGPLRRNERTGETELVIDPQGAISVDPSRGLGVRVGDGLEVSSASPFAVRVRPGDGMRITSDGRIEPRTSSSVQIQASTGKLIATPAAVDVTTSTGDLNVEEALERLDSAKIDKSIADAKGDLIVATAANTVTRLAVGADGECLTADSSETTGMRWSYPLPEGTVLFTATSDNPAAAIGYGTWLQIGTTTLTVS